MKLFLFCLIASLSGVNASRGDELQHDHFSSYLCSIDEPIVSGSTNGFSVPRVSLVFDEQVKKLNAEWLRKSIREVLAESQKITNGTPRVELLKTFTPGSGLSNATQGTFVHHLCPEIKVDVEFHVAQPGDKLPAQEQPSDTVKSISKPYLQMEVVD